MSDDEVEIEEPEEAGTPAWVMTFADLMSLLMCFFVLLLSFSEMDLKKFKQIAGSMNKAFGVQRMIKKDSAPRGTSVVTQEFSPGKPEPTPINEIRQTTTDELEDVLKIERKDVDSAEGMAKDIANELIEDIESGKIEIEVNNDKIILRILEKGSFDSGSATLKPSFIPIMDRIGKVLEKTPGQVSVAGYTDNIPIQTDIFRSNWELSATRAVTVGQALLNNKKLNPKNFVMSGYGSNNPIAPNDNLANRAKNRRVELVITQGGAEEENNVIEENTEIDEVEAEQEQESQSQAVDTESTFPPSTEQTGVIDDYLKDEGDLGVFNEDTLYNYDLDDVQLKQQPPTEKKDAL